MRSSAERYHHDAAARWDQRAARWKGWRRRFALARALMHSRLAEDAYVGALRTKDDVVGGWGRLR